MVLLSQLRCRWCKLRLQIWFNRQSSLLFDNLVFLLSYSDAIYLLSIFKLLVWCTVWKRRENKWCQQLIWSQKSSIIQSNSRALLGRWLHLFCLWDWSTCKLYRGETRTFGLPSCGYASEGGMQVARPFLILQFDLVMSK